MNSEKEVLNAIYQNSKMGVESINTIISKANDSQIRDRMLEDKIAFDQIANNASTLIFKEGGKPEEKNKFSKFTAEMSARMTVMNDNSPSKLAEMMMQGASCGIVDITRVMNHAKSIKPEVNQLATNLLEQEEKIF
ncbi:MAG TPA: hypothetical protein DCY74_05940, partial [Clostridiales bacterium]|nr:hypothetical protein [Clostridiales bacterium]